MTLPTLQGRKFPWSKMQRSGSEYSTGRGKLKAHSQFTSPTLTTKRAKYWSCSEAETGHDPIGRSPRGNGFLLEKTAWGMPFKPSTLSRGLLPVRYHPAPIVVSSYLFAAFPATYICHIEAHCNIGQKTPPTWKWPIFFPFWSWPLGAFDYATHRTAVQLTPIAFFS